MQNVFCWVNGCTYNNEQCPSLSKRLYTYEHCLLLSIGSDMILLSDSTKQCWLIIMKVQWRSSEEIYISKILSKFPRGRWVNSSLSAPRYHCLCRWQTSWLCIKMNEDILLMKASLVKTMNIFMNEDILLMASLVKTMNIFVNQHILLTALLVKPAKCQHNTFIVMSVLYVYGASIDD